MNSTRIEVIWSPDDHGYYGEVVDKKSGRTLYTTPVLKSEMSAVANAQRWMSTKVTLTKLERIALADLWLSSKGNGHDFGYPDELPSINQASRGGVVASLSNKRVIELCDNSRDHLPNQFEFTDLGRALFLDFENSSELKAH